MTGITDGIWDLLPTEKAVVFMTRHVELSKRLEMKNSRKL